MTAMSIRTFLKTAAVLPRDSILLRGPHGIGKSQVVRQMAKIYAAQDKIPVDDYEIIDRRLSQMSEGDMIGLPSTDGEVTRFNPPDWIKRACNKPCMLFLDEFNRGTNEVQQAGFQIVLDRELNGWTLHPLTRVFAAINTGANYTVNEMDPALLDRFWTIDLTPTVEDWTAWARADGGPDAPAFAREASRVHSNIVDFVAGAEKWLDAPTDQEPGTVTPSRRSWVRLNDALMGAGIMEEPNHELFYPMCLGYIGTMATIAFSGFVKTIDNQISAEEVLKNYAKVKSKMNKLGQEKQNILIEKVSDHVTKKCKTLTDCQGKNLRDFMKDLPGELRVSAWSKLTQGSGVDNLELAKSVHKWCVETVLETLGVSTEAALKAMAVSTEQANAAKKNVKK